MPQPVTHIPPDYAADKRTRLDHSAPAAGALAFGLVVASVLCSPLGAPQAQQLRAPPPRVEIAPAPELLEQASAPLGATALAGQQERVWHKTEDGAHPSGEEQAYVWLMNRARHDPSAEGAFLADTDDSDVESAISFFELDVAMLQDEFDAIAAKPPAAFDRACTWPRRPTRTT